MPANSLTEASEVCQSTQRVQVSAGSIARPGGSWTPSIDAWTICSRATTPELRAIGVISIGVLPAHPSKTGGP
jgi:hypothetical protein